MFLTEASLEAIERTADRARNVEVLLLVQILREVRQIAAMGGENNHNSKKQDSL